MSEAMRPLVPPDKIMMDYAAGKMLVLAQGLHPLITHRVAYFADKSLTGTWDDPRATVTTTPPPKPFTPPPSPPASPAPPSSPPTSPPPGGNLVTASLAAEGVPKFNIFDILNFDNFYRMPAATKDPAPETPPTPENRKSLARTSDAKVDALADYKAQRARQTIKNLATLNDLRQQLRKDKPGRDDDDNSRG